MKKKKSKSFISISHRLSLNNLDQHNLTEI